MSIKGYVDELEQLQTEIKRNNARNRALRQRVKELEASIADYLASKGQHGVKYKGRAIVLEEKEKRAAKGRKDKQRDMVAMLEELGVNNADEAYTRLMDAGRKSPVSHRKIKFKKLQKF